MCQMNVVIQQANENEEVIENVSKLETADNGVSLNSLFEESKFIPEVYVKSIDFMSGTVILSPLKE